MTFKFSNELINARNYLKPLLMGASPTYTLYSGHTLVPSEASKLKRLHLVRQLANVVIDLCTPSNLLTITLNGLNRI